MTKRVLVCEDDRAIRLLLYKLLERRGFSAECVATGAEALARLRRDAYDLILLDLLTPVVSGFDVIRFLERERPYLLARVIVVTALQRAFEETLPVAAFVRKPFDLTELGRIIDRVLARESIGGHGPSDRRQAEGGLR
jgi:CheY-like chemotaxis protein